MKKPDFMPIHESGHIILSQGGDFVNTRKALYVLLLAGLLFSLAGSPIHAATTATPQATITISAGTISISSTGSITLTGVTLDGDDHDSAATAAPSFTLIDASGAGAGWNVTLQSSNFSDGGTGTIGAANFKFTSGGTITKVKGQAVDPTNGPKETGLSAATLDSARKIITTAATYGKGKYTYDPTPADFVLTVAADTTAGAYTATVTATIASGP